MNQFILFCYINITTKMILKDAYRISKNFVNKKTYPIFNKNNVFNNKSKIIINKEKMIYSRQEILSKLNKKGYF